MNPPFADRGAAGQALAERLLALQLRAPIVVLALPRGGVPVAAPVARALGAPLHLLQVRKIGAPGQPELALAAVADTVPPTIVVDDSLRRLFGLSRADIDAKAEPALAEMARRRQAYGATTLPDLRAHTAIVIDDGIATGTSMRAALRALRERQPARVVLAVPVAPAETLDELSGEVDDTVCLAQPQPFGAVGRFYLDFHQVSDAEVTAALRSVEGC